MDARELASLRAIPLSTVLEGLGATRDPKDPARNWKIGGSRITVTDSRFFDHNGAGAVHRMRTGKAGGGGAIDLVQYLKNVSFPEATLELKGLAAQPRREAYLPAPMRPRDARPLPMPASDRSGRARWYLTSERALPGRVVDAALESGKVFTDTKGNVVFRLSDETGHEVGFEVRGTYERPYHSVHGAKGLFIVKADATKRAAFVESGIEALSYQALKGQGLIVSTTGNAVDLPARFARSLQERGYEVIAAFNADLAGDRMAAHLRRELKGPLTRDRPSREGQDWNDELKGQRRGAHSWATLAEGAEVVHGR
jgi:hypothetical protein